MAKKKDTTFDDMDEDEAGTQTAPSAKAAQGMDDPRSQEEKDLSDKELRLKRERELDAMQREEASKEYADKMEEAEKKRAEQYEGDERPEDPDKPPEACEQFEGYGEFFVTQDVNIRHQDKKRGDKVALNWEDYQALRDQKVYCEPVPKAPEEERPAATPL